MKNFLKGFSLIEMIMVILILAVTSGIAMGLIHQGFLNYFNAERFSSRSQMGSYSIERMTDELRYARAITAATATSVTFTDQDNNSIVFSTSASTLRRQANGGTQRTLATSASITFAYFDQN